MRAFAWDAAGRPARATVFTLTTYFTYTGDGTRVALEVEGVGVTDFIPDRGGRILGVPRECGLEEENVT